MSFSKLIPSYGYSVNLHHEIFEGQNPDLVGFFGEYIPVLSKNFIPKEHPKIISTFDNLLWKTGIGLPRKIFRKFLLKIDDMIPLDRKQYFQRVGTYKIREMAKIKQFMYSEFTFYLEELDSSLPNNYVLRLKKVGKKIKNLIDSEDNLFISLSCLDHYGHDFGPSSLKYTEILMMLDEIISDMLLSLNADTKVVLLSDHGMADFRGTVNLMKLEKRLGKFFGKEILYFYDSLYFRAWFLDDKKKCKPLLLEELAKIPGNVISNEERAKYGISKRIHGDLLFLLDEGYTFSPNYFGYRTMKGYHGYKPGTESQYGVVGFKGDSNKDVSVLTSESVFNRLKEYLDNEE